jgi:hypothetical protein
VGHTAIQSIQFRAGPEQRHGIRIASPSCAMAPALRCQQMPAVFSRPERLATRFHQACSTRRWFITPRPYFPLRSTLATPASTDAIPLPPSSARTRFHPRRQTDRHKGIEFLTTIPRLGSLIAFCGIGGRIRQPEPRTPHRPGE